MQPHSSRTLRTAIITEPEAAHLDDYLESIAACRGIGPVAYSDPSGQTFDEARLRLGPVSTYTSPTLMLEGFRPSFAIVLLEAAHSPQWILAALRAGCDVLSE